MKEGFLWGVSSSGYQCEGGYNGTGQPHNNWAEAEASGRVATTGSATDFWHRHAGDFALCRNMGLNAFRLSIEWARVQPSATSEVADTPPPFDEDALAHYGRILTVCRREGLEPVVTLQHFTHPAWLGADAWRRDDIPELFAAFVRKTCLTLNQCLAREGLPPIRWYITINEPNMLVLNTYITRIFPGGGVFGFRAAIQAYNRLLAAHVRAYNALHDAHLAQSWPRPQVTLNTFCNDSYWSERLLLDLLVSRERCIARTDLDESFRDAARRMREALRGARLPFQTDPFVWLGRLVLLVANRIAPFYATASAFAFFLDELDRSPRAAVLDYLALDYYDPFTGHLFRPPSFHDLEFKHHSATGHLMAGLSRKWWDWQVLPEGLHFFCQFYHKEYPHLGILIAENGMAQRCKMDNTLCSPRRDRVSRSQFLEAHIAQIRRLVREGVPLLGYLHWSLTDNYEWGSFTPRFGIYHIDYPNNARRLIVDPFGDNPAETYRKNIGDF